MFSPIVVELKMSNLAAIERLEIILPGLSRNLQQVKLLVKQDERNLVPEAL